MLYAAPILFDIEKFKSKKKKASVSDELALFTWSVQQI